MGMGITVNGSSDTSCCITIASPFLSNALIVRISSNEKLLKETKHDQKGCGSGDGDGDGDGVEMEMEIRLIDTPLST